MNLQVWKTDAMHGQQNRETSLLLALRHHEKIRAYLRLRFLVYTKSHEFLFSRRIPCIKEDV